MNIKRKKNESEGSQQDKRIRISQDSVTPSAPDSSGICLGSSTEEAEVGIIETIQLKNFMCHTRLKFNFCSNINFIVGKNGSGKSATLTALVVGLGGKALVTGRGHAIKDFILNGKKSAEILIKLRNRGNDAFDHDKYGDTIIIERILNISGVNGYKLKSEKGSVISEKREDLLRMLDHFNIQVDNPVSILNQEVSRHFLSSSSPHDKYKFFLKATQIEQIEREYCNIDEQRRITREKLRKKYEVLRDLEKEVQTWKKRYRMHQSMNELRQKIEGLKNESAWSQVIEKEQACLKVEQQLNDEHNRHLRYEEKVDQSQVQQEEAKKNVLSVKERLKLVSTALDSLNPQYDEGKAKHEETRRKLRMATLEHRKILTKLQPYTKDRELLVAKIDELRLSTQSQSVDEETKKRKEELQVKTEKKAELDAKIRMTITHMDKLKVSVRGYEEDLQKLSHEEREFRQQGDRKLHELQNMESSRKNNLHRFGKWVPQLLLKIDDAYAKRRFKEKPRGPMGACLKLRDPKWALAVERCLMSFMTTFCCDNYNDEKVLEQLMASMNISSRPTIIVSSFSNQLYDVRRHAVKLDNHWSVLDALVIDDPVIANFCIDQRGIESILLFESNNEARTTMCDNPPKNCTQAFLLNGDQIFPSPNFRYYSSKARNSRFLQADVEGHIQILKHEHKVLEQRLAHVKTKMDEIRNEKERNVNSLQETKAKHYKLGQAVSCLHREILELNAVDETESIDVTVLEREVKELSKKIEMLETEKLKCKEEIDESQEIANKLEKELEEVQEKISQIINNKLDPLKDQLTEAEQEVSRSSQRLKHYEIQKKDHEKKLKELEASCQKVQQIVKENQELADRICTRVNTRRTPAQLDREIEQYTQQLQNQEQNLGSKDEVTKKYHEAKLKFDTSSKDISAQNNFLENLDIKMSERKVTCDVLRREMGTRVRHMFMLFLCGKNFNGRIDFDHDREMLNLCVQPLVEIKENVKDLKSLSGGERSYSTMCFILALWEATESPFRILDEFDVFMDMVTRRFCMELMLDTAKNKRNKQFLFLTPQDMSALVETPNKDNLKVYRMPDPLRKQQNEVDQSQETD